MKLQIIRVYICFQMGTLVFNRLRILIRNIIRTTLIDILIYEMHCDWIIRLKYDDDWIAVKCWNYT